MPTFVGIPVPGVTAAVVPSANVTVAAVILLVAKYAACAVDTPERNAPAMPLTAATRASLPTFTNFGNAVAASTPRMAITIISSTMVKPADFDFIELIFVVFIFSSPCEIYLVFYNPSWNAFITAFHLFYACNVSDIPSGNLILTNFPDVNQVHYA
jgi:hypothetical protein